MSFDFTVGFPLKQVISSVDPIEVELTSIDGITFYISVIFRNHRLSILGVKLRADPIEKLPITTFIEIMIKNNVKNSENYISNEVTFWPDCYTETLYPGTIKLSEISEYLSNNGKKLKFYLSLKIMENPKQLKVPNTEVIMTEDIQSSDSIDSKSVESDQKKSDYIFREQTEKNNYLMKKRKKPPILNLSHSDSSEDSQTEHLPSNSNSDYSAKNKNISNSNKNTNSTYTSTSTSTSNSAPNSISNENSNQISIETENDNCFLDECNQAKQYFIGIKNNQLLNNQDSLYLNSVFQILFHLPIFRKLVYEFHSEKDNNYKNMIPYNLQKLFYELDLASCNKKYRKKNNDLKNKNKITDFISSDYFINSLGWNQNDFFTQHSIHDFFRILFSSFNDQKILEIFKGTLVQTISQNSIQNTAQMNIKGKNGHSLTKSNEDFFNISLNIKGFNSIEESLSRFTSKESINRKSDGKNNGLTIQTTFVTLPIVLQIFLNRLEYDSHEDTNKINGQVRFPLNLDMNKFVIPNDQNLNYIYTLYCVLVHEGDPLDGGKYYTYINHFDFNKNKKSQQNEEIKSKNNEVIHESNSLKEESDRNTKEGDDFINQWLLFDNEIVKQTTENNAIEKNFGGDEVNTSAVMLIYVRNDSLQRIFDVDFTFLHYLNRKTQIIQKKSQSIKERSIEMYFHLL
ncbi:hypothetical protein TRFO_41829 [Tritrichomonas foetus]|uniref:USP domain-containing protein n=1 Tax=Tritrichomonas foetus TaxID=1144522 RepID=A0A1J4KYW9_9EUKA|nr:hypothetical protein TRFO_41829 [Tritrichomonas foetus]|eukprot:OHT16354.1 hypothetical protein TRFO_41829 [Tritrichomonas foetus]